MKTPSPCNNAVRMRKVFLAFLVIFLPGAVLARTAPTKCRRIASLAGSDFLAQLCIGQGREDTGSAQHVSGKGRQNSTENRRTNRKLAARYKDE
jgi:hypothetical protein